MKSKKIFESICFGLLAFMIVALLMTGHRKTEASRLALRQNAEKEIKQEMLSLKKEIANLKLNLASQEEHIKLLKDSKTNKDIRETMEAQLNLNKKMAGLVDLSGPGIYISISDNQANEVVGESVMSDIVHDSDILSIINDLKLAGAEAISINGERILSVTGVNCGGPVILVNQESLTAPFVIKAIGDPKPLYAAVTVQGTTAYNLKNVYELDLTVKASDYILIPKYAHEIKLKYIKKYTEGEAK